MNSIHQFNSLCCWASSIFRSEAFSLVLVGVFVACMLSYVLGKKGKAGQKALTRARK